MLTTMREQWNILTSNWKTLQYRKINFPSWFRLSCTVIVFVFLDWAPHCVNKCGIYSRTALIKVARCRTSHFFSTIHFFSTASPHTCKLVRFQYACMTFCNALLLCSLVLHDMCDLLTSTLDFCMTWTNCCRCQQKLYFSKYIQ